MIVLQLINKFQNKMIIDANNSSSVFMNYWFNPGLAALREVEAQIFNSTIDQLKLQDTAHALDIGVGNGYFSSMINIHFKLGIDILPGQLDEARRFNQHDLLKQFDISKRQSSKNIINADLIISNSVLEHISDLDTAIKNISNLLIKGGYALISVPLETSIKCSDHKFEQPYRETMRTYLGHTHMYDKQTWEVLFVKGGLRIVESRYYLFKEFAGYIKSFCPFKTILNDRIAYATQLHSHFIAEFGLHQRKLFFPIMERELKTYHSNPSNTGDCLFLVLRKEG